MSKNIVQTDKPQMTIKLCKATNTFKIYNSFFLLFHCNNVSMNAAQRYVIRTLFGLLIVGSLSRNFIFKI